MHPRSLNNNFRVVYHFLRYYGSGSMPMFAAGRSRRVVAAGTGAVAGATTPTRWRDLELDEANTLR